MISVKQVGSPRAWDYHQEIILETIINLHPEVDQHPGWKILYESLVTKNRYDNYPDIIIKDEYKYPVFIMEVTNRKGISYDRRKCLKLQARFPECEFYIFNYETDILYTLTADGTWLSSEDYILKSALFLHPILDYIFIPKDEEM